MKLKTFRGGVHPLSSKRLTKEKPVETAPLPGIAVIPLSQHTGVPAKPVVEPKAEVKVGAMIGELEGRISANVHSSVSGVVKSIEPRTHPVGGNLLSVVIESNKEDQKEDYVQAPDVDSLTPTEIVDRVQQAGIVGLGGAAFPTHVKLCPPEDKPVDMVILNGAECEPYLTSDYRLLIERSEDILCGGRLVMKALGAQKGYIAIEDNKREAISRFESLAGESGFELCVLETKYPQGGERQLIHAISGREVPCGGLPFDVGVCVSNVGTVAAVCEACTTGKPLIERVVTVTGAVQEPKNVLARIGTPFKDLVEFCGGYLGEPEKILMGGPMMGIAQISDDVPVVKATSGILVQAVGSCSLDEPCIRCGSCIDACGMGLLPAKLGDCIESGAFEEAKELGLLDCIECGSCAWVCPSRRNLVHLYKYGKLKLRQMK
jgi:electron transport complex protein RnfC